MVKVWVAAVLLAGPTALAAGGPTPTSAAITTPTHPVEPPDPPTEDELIELLAEKARQGNVAAIRSLLARDHATDPRERAMAIFQEMVAERQP